jgi:hypothetical protein
MNQTQALRNRVMGMESADCRQELADTLGLLDKLEADFVTVVLEVAALSYDRNRESYDTSRQFNDMMTSRGIELP